MSLIAKLWRIRFLRFVVVGLVNTGFSYGVYVALLFMALDFRVANLTALVSGTVFSFKTQGRFVFENHNNGLFLRFLMVWAVIYMFNILLIQELIDYGFDAYVSGAIALIPVTLLSFVLQKTIVFRNKGIVRNNIYSDISS